MTSLDTGVENEETSMKSKDPLRLAGESDCADPPPTIEFLLDPSPVLPDCGKWRAIVHNL